MNDNLARVIAYLESANRGEVSMSEEIIDQAAEDFKQALKKQFTINSSSLLRFMMFLGFLSIAAIRRKYLLKRVVCL